MTISSSSMTGLEWVWDEPMEAVVRAAKLTEQTAREPREKDSEERRAMEAELGDRADAARLLAARRNAGLLRPGQSPAGLWRREQTAKNAALPDGTEFQLPTGGASAGRCQ
jgi:hypothetical protein